MDENDCRPVPKGRAAASGFEMMEEPEPVIWQVAEITRSAGCLFPNIRRFRQIPIRVTRGGCNFLDFSMLEKSMYARSICSYSIINSFVILC